MEKKSQGRKIVIGNPASYMERKTGKRYKAAERFFPWKDCAAFCTTGQFENLDGGLMRHCGPTAITNLILTMQNAGKLKDGSEKDGGSNHNYIQDMIEQEQHEDQVFRQVVGIGRNRKLYWNTNVLGRFGGTFDLMSGSYIRSAVKEFFPQLPVKTQLVLRPSGEKAVQALKKGSVLYLMLHGHPTYGDHHVLCYGYAFVEPEKEQETGGEAIREKNANTGFQTDGQKKLFLLIADGWANRTRYIPAEQLRHSIWFEVSTK